MTLLDSIYLKIEALRVPLHALIELTQRCPENCLHCYIKGSRDKYSLSKDDKELTFGQLAELLGDLAKEGTLNLTLTGGEAMLREDFFDIAGLAKAKGFAITILSNGQLIDEAHADRLAKIMPVCVYFSLYGCDSITHDRITRLTGSFEKLLRAISLLKKGGIKVGLKTMMMKENLHQLKELFVFGKSLGVETHDFGEELTCSIDGSCRPKALQIDEPLLYQYYRQDIPEAPKYIEELPQEEALKRPMCGAGVFGVCISCYGDVYPCAELRFPLGNIKYESFKALWHKEDGFLTELRSIKEYRDLPDCLSCRLVNFCRRCPGRALYDAGDWRLCYENAYKRAQITKRINDELSTTRFAQDKSL